ncbi:hypothetical protein GCM10010406_51850 [Streptomyces thermolineatus]|uniref:DUF3320 domain-containing protein n=1 Tax=Streptomyces thermolineatus TaxID=44033 RepID=A0ABN3MUL7_9ACTN
MPSTQQPVVPSGLSLHKVLEDWRDSLTDPGTRNRLLGVGHSPAPSLEILAPGPDALLGGTGAGWVLVPETADAAADRGAAGTADAKAARDTAGGPAVAQPTAIPRITDGVPRLPSPRADAAGGPARLVVRASGQDGQSSPQSVLDSLYRSARQVFDEHGTWTLHLGARIVEGTLPGTQLRFTAPLYLLPVELEGPEGGERRLVVVEGAGPVLNPALAVLLSTSGKLDLDDPAKAAEALDAALKDPAGGWTVTERAVLSLFEHRAETAFQDLLKNWEAVAAAPPVRAAVRGERPAPVPHGYSFEPSDGGVFALSPDAPDSSGASDASDASDGGAGDRAAAVADAVAALLGQGRTVLLAGRRAAALEVVRERLADTGLTDRLLPLYGRSAGNKEVARALAASLAGRLALLEQAGARAGRAAALEEVRQPLGRSLNEVRERLADLEDAPAQTLPSGWDASRLSAEALEELLDAARSLSAAWRPLREGDGFVWRGLADAPAEAGASEGNVEAGALRAADAALDALEQLESAVHEHTDLAGATDATGPALAERLHALLSLCEDRPEVPAQWLTGGDLDELERRTEDAERSTQEVQEAERAAAERLGPAWRTLPAGLGTDTEPDADPAADADADADAENDAENDADAAAENSTDAENDTDADGSTVRDARLDPDVLSGLTAAQARALAERLEADAPLLRRHAAALLDVARLYGVPAPRTHAQAVALCDLVELSAAEHKPDASWLTDEGRAAARAAVDTLEQAVAGLQAARGEAVRTFGPQVLEEDGLEALAERFADRYRGLRGRLSGAYRADKKILASLSGTGTWSKDLPRELPSAVAWQRAHRKLEQAGQEHAGLLAAHWQGEETDFEALRALVDTAERVSVLAPEVDDPAALTALVASGGTPQSSAVATAARIRTDLLTWHASLAPDTPAGRPDLSALALVPPADAAAWCAAHVTPLRAAAELAETVDDVVARSLAGAESEGDVSWAAVAPSTESTVGEARAAVELVERARAAGAAGSETGDEPLFGPLGDDHAAAAAALAWARRARQEAGLPGGLPENAASALLAAKPDPVLGERLDAWRTAVGQLLGRFDAERAAGLEAALAADARAALAPLAGDRTGPHEWHAHRRAVAVLAEHGLGGLPEAAASGDVPPGDFPEALERAVLHAWTDRTTADDERLASAPGTETGTDAGTEVSTADLAAAEALRAHADQVAVIEREAAKESGHMPVRRLMEECRDVVPLLTPCFLTTPSAAVRSLPADHRFDVVFLDEDLRPHTAETLSCLYRGRSLIVPDAEQPVLSAALLAAGPADGGTGDDAVVAPADETSADETPADETPAGTVHSDTTDTDADNTDGDSTDGGARVAVDTADDSAVSTASGIDADNTAAESTVAESTVAESPAAADDTDTPAEPVAEEPAGEAAPEPVAEEPVTAAAPEPEPAAAPPAEVPAPEAAADEPAPAVADDAADDPGTAPAETAAVETAAAETALAGTADATDTAETADTSEAPAAADGRWTPYVVSAPAVPEEPRPALHTAKAQEALVSVFREILAVEGPIHQDLLFLRAREAWGVARMGARIKESMENVLERMAEDGGVERDGEFVDRTDRTGPVPVRTPVDALRRKAGQVAPSERRAAIVALLGEDGASRTALQSELVAVFGWGRASKEVTAALDADLEALKADGLITGTARKLRRA